MKHVPPFRRLRGYSFDPSLSMKMDTAFINERVFTIPWENDLEEGPVGEYVEVIDVDPPSRCCYEPVDLNDPFLLAQDGLTPATSNPQFHQQMVYAVVMTTIKNFERAIGRPVMWSDRKPQDIWNDWEKLTEKQRKIRWAMTEKFYVKHLTIYPHALREANAYYSPVKKALLFGYFPAAVTATPYGVTYPGGMVFGCLSHDIVAHETAHAILDGIHPNFMEVTQTDGLAFHEAFADIVALFQHFTFVDVVRHQIASTRGDLGMNNLLGQLAQQFGQATGTHGSLRNALGEEKDGKWQRSPPDPTRMQTEMEPHARGSILVSAVFDAFITIYESRIRDLKRIASEGTGVLRDGELPPDLVNRLAEEAVTVANQVLTMCIRALDYCPPVDIDFGDYLRALITADCDIVLIDTRGYRLAFVDAFREHGIYPAHLKGLSEDNLVWDRADSVKSYPRLNQMGDELRRRVNTLSMERHRSDRWHAMRHQRIALHEFLQKSLWDQDENKGLQLTTGLDFSIRHKRGGEDVVNFRVETMWSVQRQRPDGSVLNQVVFTLVQRRPLDFARKDGGEIWGGCTVVVDMGRREGEGAIRYVISKPLYNQENEGGRIHRALMEQKDPTNLPLAATYGGDESGEPFAMLHTSF